MISKIGNKEVKLHQYIGKNVLAKEKGKLKRDLNVIDEKNKSFIFTELDKLELMELPN